MWQVATLLEHAATDPSAPEFQPNNLLSFLGNLGIKSITCFGAATKRDRIFFNQYFKAWNCHPKLTVSISSHVSRYPRATTSLRPRPSSRPRIPKSQRLILGKSKFLALAPKTSSSHVRSNHTSWQSSINICEQTPKNSKRLPQTVPKPRSRIPRSFSTHIQFSSRSHKQVPPPERFP